MHLEFLTSETHEEVERVSPGGRPAKDGTRVQVRLTDDQRDAILAAAIVENITTLSDAGAILAARAAEAVLAAAGPAGEAARAEVKARSTTRRAERPAPALDPFEVLLDGGPEALRQRLQQLQVEQLHDLIAHHGMDHDRRARRWTDPERLTERIIEHTVTRAAKGSALR
jgi:uncharacterized protein (DUF1778 family)